MKYESIQAYNDAWEKDDKCICVALRTEIDRYLPEAESKIWHAHPVWFLAGNPIVGYGKLKDCIRLMFWSGQSFTTPGLSPEGSFKAATFRFTSPDEIAPNLLSIWLGEARIVQWDYKNITRRKGRLERL